MSVPKDTDMQSSSRDSQASPLQLPAISRFDELSEIRDVGGYRRSMRPHSDRGGLVEARTFLIPSEPSQ